jgi:transmembrane sensor
LSYPTKDFMDYEDINAESLVMDDRFQRFCLGIDESAKEYWENWLEKNPGKKEEFYKAKELFSILNGGINSQNVQKDREVFIERLKNEGVLLKHSADSKIVELPVSGKRSFPYSIIAAAIFLGIVALTAFLIWQNNDSNNLAQNNTASDQILDRVPGSDKAILTLADGRTIVLDSSTKGMISEQGNIRVLNLNGMLTYKGEGTGNVVYNTITTPKGGQYQLVLVDGSKVWLNASSSLRFPSDFQGKERVVELTGEGYFEVASNSSMPFHVNVGDLKVEVLGTDFNIMAYSDEVSVKTTLIEGKVKVHKGALFTILTPGQQVQVSPDGSIKIDKNANVAEAIAWKNGLFQFSGADMRTVMRHIGRWYNVETVIEGDMKNIHLSGKVSRNMNLSQVIQVLEESGIDIKAEGNRLIASPKL